MNDSNSKKKGGGGGGGRRREEKCKNGEKDKIRKWSRFLSPVVTK